MSHLSADVIGQYASGAATPATAAAVDHHLGACPACRDQLNAAVTAAQPERIDLQWFGVVAELDRPRHGVVERMLTRLGLPADVVRLMAATPALRRSWYLAIGASMFFALAAANPDRPDPTILWFLALAPIIPVVGVALAYGPGVDPSYETSTAAPMSGFRLVLLRSLAVLSTSVVIGGLCSLLLLRRHGGGLVGAWLLPALALSAVCLVLMTVVAPRVAGAIVAGGWLAVVVLTTGEGAADQLAMFRGPAQLAYLTCFVLAAVVLALRRRTFDVARDRSMGAT